MVQWINPQFLVERFDNDTEIITELFTVFLSEYQRLLHELKQALVCGENPSKIGHGIKGMCRDVGADGLASLAADIEHGTADVAVCTSQLTEAWPAVQQEVAQWLAKNPVYSGYPFP
jgi:HPt (histidine-containing phosphotransfer) domain-containing protein